MKNFLNWKGNKASLTSRRSWMMKSIVGSELEIIRIFNVNESQQSTVANGWGPNYVPNAILPTSRTGDLMKLSKLIITSDTVHCRNGNNFSGSQWSHENKYFLVLTAVNSKKKSTESPGGCKTEICIKLLATPIPRAAGSKSNQA